MTVANTPRKAGPYNGNGATVSFPFTFKVFSASDVLVVRADATGAETTLALTTDYTVSLNADQNASPGGTVTPVVVLATGKSLTITSALDYLQPVDLTNNGGFYPAVISTALDRLTIFCQQLGEKLGRTLSLAVSDVTGAGAYRAGGNRIQDVADPLNAKDAVNLQTTQSLLAANSDADKTYARALAYSGGSAPPLSVVGFGVTGNGSTDDLAAILLATASGAPLYWPAGTYLVSSTVLCTVPQRWVTHGGVIIKLNAPAGSAARPVLDFQDMAYVSGDFTIDAQADTKGYTAPTIYNGNVIAGSAVMVQGDGSTIENIKVQNAWDNGIAVIRLNSITGAEVPGSPKSCRISGIRSYRCGAGVHAGATPGKIGAGVDVGSGSACVVSDCVDTESYCGFILDTGAGAQATFTNCIAWATRLDAANPLNGSGYGFYVGSGDSVFINCYSVLSEYRGWWYDGQNCDFVNCAAYLPQKEGLLIKGIAAAFANFRIKGAGAKTANTYDAVIIDSSAATITELMLDIYTTGTNHRYGVTATGANPIRALLTGSITGTTGKTNLGSYEIGTRMVDIANGKKTGINRDNPGVEFDIFGKGRVSAASANASYATNPFGDSDSNGTFFIEDYANPGKRIAMGFDPVNDVAVIQAMHAGTAKKSMLLNPSGGMVGIGQGNLAVGASNGFMQIPVMAGAPTGTPAALAGYACIVFDTTNSKLWIRSGAVWKYAQLT